MEKASLHFHTKSLEFLLYYSRKRTFSPATTRGLVDVRAEAEAMPHR